MKLILIALMSLAVALVLCYGALRTAERIARTHTASLNIDTE